MYRRLLLSILLVSCSGNVAAQAPNTLEPDEGGIGGTGNSIDSHRKPELIDRPEFPERIEKMEPIDMPTDDISGIHESDVGGSVEVVTPATEGE